MVLATKASNGSDAMSVDNKHQDGDEVTMRSSAMQCACAFKMLY